MSKVTGRYVPATTRAQLPKGSRHRAMDAFLMSDRVADVTTLVTYEIAAAASALAAVEARDTGDYATSFHVRETEPLVAGSPPFPRRTMVVYNSDEAAPSVEFGARRKDDRGRVSISQPKRILWRSGAPYHTLRGIG